MWRGHSENIHGMNYQGDPSSRTDQLYDGEYASSDEQSYYSNSDQLLTPPPMDSAHRYSYTHHDYSAHSEPRSVLTARQTYPNEVCGTDANDASLYLRGDEMEEWERGERLSDMENEAGTSSDEEAIISLGQKLNDIKAENSMLQSQNAQLERDAERLTQQLRLFQKHFGMRSASSRLPR